MRENKASIPYPNYLGTFVGQIETGETAEEAIKRETWEELEYRLEDFEYIGNFPFDGYDNYMFRKVDLNVVLDNFVVKEGQGAVFIPRKEVLEDKYNFAFNCREILLAYFQNYQPHDFC